MISIHMNNPFLNSFALPHVKLRGLPEILWFPYSPMQSPTYFFCSIFGDSGFYGGCKVKSVIDF